MNAADVFSVATGLFNSAGSCGGCNYIFSTGGSAFDLISMEIGAYSYANGDFMSSNGAVFEYPKGSLDPLTIDFSSMVNWAGISYFELNTISDIQIYELTYSITTSIPEPPTLFMIMLGMVIFTLKHRNFNFRN